MECTANLSLLTAVALIFLLAPVPTKLPCEYSSNNEKATECATLASGSIVAYLQIICIDHFPVECRQIEFDLFRTHVVGHPAQITTNIRSLQLTT